MKKFNRILAILLAAMMLFAGFPLTASAAETYGYEVVVNPSPVAIGEEVTLIFRLTDYTAAKSGIRGFQIDITDVDDVLHQAVCTSLVKDTEDLISNTAKYQSGRDLVRHAYAKMSGAMSYTDSDLLKVTFTIPETYTEAGTLSLPLKALIQNEAGDKLTYTSTIEIQYAPAGEITNPDVVSVDVIWGAMEFVYSDGTWNTVTHSYDGTGWTDQESGFVTVANTGTQNTTAAFSFTSNFDRIQGSFTDGTSPIDGPVDVVPNQSKTVYLCLSGTPMEELDKAVLGTVTVRIGGE